jgi:transcriptional regulator with XRE-family HTH domain
MSQETMAQQLGIDPGTLARWERGSRQPQGKYLARVVATSAE